MMHATLPCVAPFSQKSTVCSHGNYVDIVAVVGSIPATPTTQPLENIQTAGLFTKLPIGSMDLERADLVLETPPQP